MGVVNDINDIDQLLLNIYQRTMSNCDAYQKIKKDLDRLNTTVDEDFTKWFNLIKGATIVNLAPNANWTDNEGLIQVMRLGTKDLPINHNINEDDYDLFSDQTHPYERYLDVIKLPMIIPENSSHPVPQFLFVRPDEYELMTLLCRETKNSILLGNPGISKSWFQWKYILFCCRVDLFDLLWPYEDMFIEGTESEDEESDDDEENKDQLCKIDQEEVDDDEKIPPKKGQRYTKDKEESDEDGETPPKKMQRFKTVQEASAVDEVAPGGTQKYTKMALTPKYIVRTSGGTRSQIFFLGQGNQEVLKVKHDANDLIEFAVKGSLLLWEPLLKGVPVYYEGIDANIIATLSPDLERFKDFRNAALKLYMPCPSLIQLRLMGVIVRQFSEDPNLRPTDDEVCEIAKNCGPFIRHCFSWGYGNRRTYDKERNKDLRLLTSDKLRDILDSNEHVMEDNKVPIGLSHRLAIIAVNRNHSYCYRDDSVIYKITCSEVIRLVKEHLRYVSCNKIAQHLIGVCSGENQLQTFLTGYMEQIFACLSATKAGLRWKSRRLMLKGQRTAEAHAPSINVFFLLTAKFKYIEDKVTLRKDMKLGTLYYPSNPAFPLVDMYYLDKDENLIGIQATVSPTHEKCVETYTSFFQKLGTTYVETKLRIFYLILPSRVREWTRDEYPLSVFWKKVKTVPQEMKDNIWFYILVPPNTFGSQDA